MTDLAELTATLIEEAWCRGLTPEPQLTVSEWADQHRVQAVAQLAPALGIAQQLCQQCARLL